MPAIDSESDQNVYFGNFPAKKWRDKNSIPIGGTVFLDVNYFNINKKDRKMERNKNRHLAQNTNINQLSVRMRLELLKRNKLLL